MAMLLTKQQLVGTNVNDLLEVAGATDGRTSYDLGGDDKIDVFVTPWSDHDKTTGTLWFHSDASQYVGSVQFDKTTGAIDDLWPNERKNQA